MKPIVLSTPSSSRPQSDPPESWTLARLYKERAPHVFRTLRALGVREADLPDVVHDVFLTVHRRRAEVRIYASVRAWVHGICVGTAANYRRKRHGREQLCAHVPEVGIARPDDGATLDLLRLLALLDDDQRAVFVLYEIEDLSMPEVAEALGCPQTTAYSRLYAARKVLRAAVQTRSGGNP